MSREAARYQALAACGAVLVAFVGVCHEVVGDVLFPWGPAFMGGPLPWHGVGFFTIVAGAAVLAGSLGLIRFPVVPFAIFAAGAGAFFVIVAAALHHQVHFFALTACAAGTVTAYAHRRAERLRIRDARGALRTGSS